MAQDLHGYTCVDIQSDQQTRAGLAGGVHSRDRYAGPATPRLKRAAAAVDVTVLTAGGASSPESAAEWQCGTASGEVATLT